MWKHVDLNEHLDIVLALVKIREDVKIGNLLILFSEISWILILRAVQRATREKRGDLASVPVS